MKIKHFLMAGSGIAVLWNFTVFSSQTQSYGATERGAGYCVWAKTNYEINASGQSVPVVHKYTELASGLNHLVNGQWVPSKEEIDILPDGTAAATNGQHQVYFPGDVYNGEIREITPDGKVLRSRPLGLSYDDGSNTVLIAVLTNSTGELISSNQVLYPNAFVGIDADLRYTYTGDGFEQDIILRAQPPMPKDFNLNPQTTKLQAMTEFINPPQPQITTTSSDDETLDFGAMRMIRGKAFLAGINRPTPGAMVNKSWMTIEGRHILVEQVPLPALAGDLSVLPQASLSQSFKPDGPLYAISSQPLLPTQHLGKAGNGTMILAKATSHDTGLVIDYQTVNGSNLSGYTFQGDTTYKITGTCYLNSGICTIEGGAVLKFSGGNIDVAGNGQLVSTAGPYHMAVLTSVNDNSVGQSIGSGSPTIGGSYLMLDGGTPVSVLNYLRFMYAARAVYYISAGGANVAPLNDCQFLHCGNVVEMIGDNNTLIQNFENTLISQCTAVVVNDYSYGTKVEMTGKNITVDQVPYLVETYSSDNNAWLSLLWNSILTGVQKQVYYLDTGGSTSLLGNNLGYSASSGSGVYQSAAGGNYYLTDSFRSANRGTANVDSTLLAQLKQKTTYPPNVSYVGTTISSDNFTAQVPRDNSGSSVDLGYHYDPLDYVFQNCTVSSGMTFPAGTAVGWQGNGLTFSGGYAIAFNGLANMPCYFVRCNTIQEADTSGDGTGIAGGAAGGWVQAAFTRFSSIGDFATFFDGSMNYNSWVDCCEFHSGAVGGVVNDNSSLSLTNDLLDRSLISLHVGTSMDYYQPSFQNCTFHGGSLTIDQNTFSSISIHDCAFDSTDLSSVNSSYAGDGTYNAYISGESYLPGTDPINNPDHDVFVTGGFNWQSGLLGSYYLPAGSPLIDANNQSGDSAAASIPVQTGSQNGYGSTYLSYFTTDPVNQTPDGGAVDIGYHYPIISPALSAGCRPTSIQLNWDVTAMEQVLGLFFEIDGFNVYRSTSPGGPYTLLTSTPLSLDAGSYSDVSVTPSVSYYYVVTVLYTDTDMGNSTTNESPYSNVAGPISTCCDPTTSGLWVDEGPTALQMAQGIMGPNVTVSNAKYTGSPHARGTFGGGNSGNLPIDQGVILATGYIYNAVGPNIQLDSLGTNFSNNGDSDLNTLISPYTTDTTQDAAVLEFDFVSSSSSVAFQYFFASEEYTDWQNSYDDVCGIFVDEANIAVVPNTTIPVSVFTINSANNSQYYQVNPLAPPVVFDTSYDGLTTLLTAQAQVTANVSHHVKIAIADTRDGWRDSAIFVQAQIICP